jgi:tRNA dimethylallyltransferase
MQRERNRPGTLHRILARLDPPSAARIHPNDKNKTMRALEVRLVEGATLSAMFQRPRAPLSGFLPVKIGLDPPRELLYARLNERAREMFDPGRLVDEVGRLLSHGVPPEAKPFESLGYKQALQMLQGKISPQQALESTQQETRRYAKRQTTWFRKEQNVHWIAGFGNESQVQAEALNILLRAGIASSQKYF